MNRVQIWDETSKKAVIAPIWTSFTFTPGQRLQLHRRNYRVVADDGPQQHSPDATFRVVRVVPDDRPAESDVMEWPPV